MPQWQAWFDRYLRNDQSAPAPPTFSAAVPATALVGRDQDRDEPTTVTAADYPGRTSGTVEQVTQSLDGQRSRSCRRPVASRRRMTSLPGGPEAVGRSGRRWPATRSPCCRASPPSSPPPVLETPLTLLGSGRIRLDVTSSTTSATLFVSLWDLGPDTTPVSPTPGPVPDRLRVAGRNAQTAVLPQSVVAPVHLVGLTPDRVTTVDVALPAVAHQVPVGHRLQVVVSSTDQAYANPKAGGRLRRSGWPDRPS